MAIPVLPRVLKYFNIFVDGIPYQAKCESVTLPNLNLVVESYRGVAWTTPLKLILALKLSRLP
ncbi:hypothetical protein BAR153v2_003150 [Bartonella sp. AR 15-3]|nr:hypothetical protein BAR153v2_003150 [Bartonella sp. AR 15-3]